MNVNATPSNVTLAGKNYVIYPLRDNDNLALDELVQGKWLLIAHQSGIDDIMRIALAEAINIRWNYPPGSRILVRYGGWGRVVFQSLRLPPETPYFDPCEGATEAEISFMVATYKRINDIKPREGEENPT